MRTPLARAACAACVLPAALFFLAAPGLAAAGVCKFKLLVSDDNGRPVRADEIQASDPLCAKMTRLEERFLKLRGGAAKWAGKVAEESRQPGKGPVLQPQFDLRLIRLSPYVDAQESPNAFYAYKPGSPRPGYIQVNRGFAGLVDTGEDPTLFGMAHEISHGVQHVLGVQGEPCHRGHEAQADRWAAGVMREAGFPGEKSPGMVAGFFGEENIASDKVLHLEEQGCREHPAGRTRYVNAVLGESLFGRKGEGGSELGRSLMKLDRDKVLGAADIVFDGDRARENSVVAAVPAEIDAAKGDFGADGVIRKSDFEPGGKLVVGRDMVPDIAAKTTPSGPAEPEQSLTGVLLAQLYRLGNLTDWTSPFIGKVIASGVGDRAQDLKGALLSGLKNMAPSDIAKKNALRLVVALQDSLGGGPAFARA